MPRPDAPIPSAAPAVRPALRLHHRPVTRAVVGTRVTLRATVDGPADSEVVAFVGPPDGPHRRLRLHPVGGGVWQGEFDVDGSLAGGAVYWIVASHPDTDPTRVLEGSRFKPLRIRVY